MHLRRPAVRLTQISVEPVCSRYTPNRYAQEMYDYEITAPDAALLLEESRKDPKLKPAVRLIDVREPWEYQTAHIEGSTLIPMGEFPSRAHQELDPDERLLILCHHGARSLSVTNWLRQQGYDAAQSIAGGIESWSWHVDTTVPRY
jgi:rhodanese-related sulfurtransferase